MNFRNELLLYLITFENDKFYTILGLRIIYQMHVLIFANHYKQNSLLSHFFISEMVQKYDFFCIWALDFIFLHFMVQGLFQVVHFENTKTFLFIIFNILLSNKVLIIKKSLFVIIYNLTVISKLLRKNNVVSLSFIHFRVFNQQIVSNCTFFIFNEIIPEKLQI